MRTRRRFLRGGTAALAALAVAGTTASMRGQENTHRNPTDLGGSAHAHPTASEPFDEMYKGRRIQGWPAHDGHHGTGSGYRVLIDGAELHVMQNGDGTWVSLIDHYEVFAAPRALARSAVDNLAGADLVPHTMHR
ncbi:MULTISPECIES: tyrosinase cofactor [unclassified Streptomyces]|uniref:Tyrosinase cofactor n=1 Tax=Streptomyces sp. NBC_00180 TaxID=2903632 RepID=A0AAU1IAV7_9ACTN|nr:tyrosinase cofactor [Streptomyces sp. NBC_01017]